MTRGLSGVLAILAIALPSMAGAQTIQSEGKAGCLAVDVDAPAGMDPADRNVSVRADCANDDYWATDADGLGRIAAALAKGQMCLSVDFRKSLLGQGQTFNVFAADDCDKALIWEIRYGFIVAEIASTVYCLEANPSPEGSANAIARIGCSGGDDSVWRVN